MRVSLLFFMFVYSIGTLAAGPGVSGGGGNVPPEERAGVPSVIFQIGRSKDMLNQILFALEADYTRLDRPGAIGTEPRLTPIYEALFSRKNGRANVFARLKNLKFVPLDKGVCYDGDKRPTAASAYPFESDEICFSAKLINESTNRANLQRAVLVLSLHEVIHKMGIREEAPIEFLERYLRDLLPPNSEGTLQDKYYRLFRLAQPGVRTGVSFILKRALKKLEGSVSWPSICLELGRLAAVADELYEVTALEETPLALYRASHQFAIQLVRDEATYLPLYCDDDAALIRNFSPAGQIEIRWDNPASPVVHMISRPKRGDLVGLRSTLSRLDRLADQIGESALQNGHLFFESTPEN